MIFTLINFCYPRIFQFFYYQSYQQISQTSNVHIMCRRHAWYVFRCQHLRDTISHFLLSLCWTYGEKQKTRRKKLQILKTADFSYNQIAGWNPLGLLECSIVKPEQVIIVIFKILYFFRSNHQDAASLQTVKCIGFPLLLKYCFSKGCFLISSLIIQ